MTKNDVKNLLKETENKIKVLQGKLRQDKKDNKIKKINTLEKLSEIKQDLLAKKGNIFKFFFVGGASLLASIFSLFLGGIKNPISLGFLIGCLSLTVISGVGAYFSIQKKMKLEKNVLLLESKLSVLNAENFDSLELDELKKQRENYYTILEALNKDSKNVKGKSKDSKSINVLKAVKIGADTNRFVDDEFDASQETLINYQKTLQNKEKNNNELTK